MGQTAMDLGGVAIKGALDRANISGDAVDYVIMGHVLQAGQGQITARQAAFNGGIPLTVPALTVNKVCLSGMNAIYLADQMIAQGDAEIVVAGGMESMSSAPFLLPDARFGGNQEVVDSMIHDGLFCAFDHCVMGEGTDRYNQDAGITRDAQDVFSLHSHERAAAARETGRFAEEIVPVKIGTVTVERDEGIRTDTSIEKLSKLKPAFDPNGTVSAGNASQISDGACALVVMSKQKAKELGVNPLGEVVGYGMVAGPDPSLLSQPSRAIQQALVKSSLGINDISLFEINEAFATVVLNSMADLSIGDDVVNINGGAIALGHPIGMSGARLILTMLYELRHQGGEYGAAGLCGGGGQGDAIILRSAAP